MHDNGRGKRISATRLSCVAVALAILIGGLALFGWWQDIPVLYSTFPGLPAMVPATAVLILLTGAGLQLTPVAPSPTRQIAALACAITVILAACLFLLGTGGLQLPSPATSLILLLLGVAIVLLQAPRPPALILIALSVFALTLPLYRLFECLLTLVMHHEAATGPFATTSLNSSLALCLLAGPALYLHPRLPFGQGLFAVDGFAPLLRLVMPWGTLMPVALAIIVEHSITPESEHVDFAIIAALGLLSAMASALLWRGYEKLRATSRELSERENLLRSITDSLPHSIAVIDASGTIIRVNQRWQEFALENSGNSTIAHGLGINYLDYCRTTPHDAYAHAALAGLEDLLTGRRDHFALEYPCHSPDRQQWFSMRASPLNDTSGDIVISHIDITERKQAELKMQRDREQQASLREMLENVFRGESLEETLGRCLDQLLAIPWLAIMPRGGIHLMAASGDHLDLTVAKNLPAEVRGLCGHLPLDRCLCGKAAISHQIVFSSHVDQRHDVTYPDMADHGHYCIPLLGQQRETVGVLVLYLLAGSQPDPEREQFLETVAGILANYVLRKRGELALEASQRELEQHQANLERQVAERTSELAINEARTRAVLHTMADGVVQIDARGSILLANYAISTLFGYDAEELIGRNISLLMPEPHRSQHDGYLENYQRTRERKIIGKHREVSGQRKDGSTFPLELTVNELVDDSGVTYIGVLRDLTLQQEMANAQAEALAQSHRLANMKSAFLANMSHEIRTPLGAVMGFARIGMRENQGRSSHETCARILEAGEHLLGVVNDILDFSKIEAGKLKIESRPFRLQAVIDASFSFVADTAKKKGIDLSSSGSAALPAWVAGDPLRVEQILVNLLSNAVKFTHHGRVALEVERSANGESLYFHVRDTGIGINAEQLGRLFGAFEQADSSTTREYGGTGLGLAISHRLARLMNGEITVDSTPGAGSTFTLTLPLPATMPQLEPERIETASRHRLTGLRLLAAEDIEANRLILDDLLMQEGAQTTFATNGQQVLDLLAEQGNDAFDAVLMDVQMPILDGFAATHEIKRRAPHLAVIGLTAHALAEERDKCLAAGMVDHVTKPIDPNTLVAAILRHVNKMPAPQPANHTSTAVLPAPTFADRLIDLPALRNRFSRKDGFLCKLASSALPSLDRNETGLATAIAQHDHETLAFTAHSLKGLAGNLFAQQVFDLAKATDDAARERQPAAFELAGQLIQLLAMFRTELAALARPAEGDD